MVSWDAYIALILPKRQKGSGQGGNWRRNNLIVTKPKLGFESLIKSYQFSDSAKIKMHIIVRSYPNYIPVRSIPEFVSRPLSSVFGFYPINCTILFGRVKNFAKVTARLLMERA